MEIVKLIKLTKKGDSRGWLIPFEKNINCPFNIKRCYFIYGTKEGVVRGKHAHYTLAQLLVCVSGSLDVCFEFGRTKKIIHLSSPNIGLYIKGLVWHSMKKFSKDAVLMVLADKEFDEKDYVRDYKVFKKINNKK